MLERFMHDIQNIIAEHHALFGPLDEPYHTILHLTDGGRGGLEHSNSQTSMVPRTSLQPGHVEDYRDLVSLFSHEYVHQWNVKRLRPKLFLDYDLQRKSIQIYCGGSKEQHRGSVTSCVYVQGRGVLRITLLI